MNFVKFIITLNKTAPFISYVGYVGMVHIKIDDVVFTLIRDFQLFAFWIITQITFRVRVRSHYAPKI